MLTNRNSKIINWLIFIALSFIWGSSFILMKKGLTGLSAFEVASIRIVSSGLVLMPVALKSFSFIPNKKLFSVFMSGVMGSLLPAYLFCIAELRVDSALAGTLNSLTPIFVILAGTVFFNTKTTFNKLAGIFIAFSGSVLLLLNQPGFEQDNNFGYILLIVLATLFYGINVNWVHTYLSDFSSLNIVAVALVLNAVPAAIVLFFSGFFSLNFSDTVVLAATGYSVVLGIFGTAIASIIFYMLIKRAGTVFSSMVTYGIPVVANFWGIVYGEQIGWLKGFCLLLILTGVYITNKRQVIKDEIK